MAIEDDFQELMTQTIVIAPYDSDDEYGEPQFGAEVSYIGRTVNKTTVVRDTNGREKISTSKTWVFGSPDIDPRDKITLDDGSQPVILSAPRYPDENGAHHCVVLT